MVPLHTARSIALLVLVLAAGPAAVGASPVGVDSPNQTPAMAVADGPPAPAVSPSQRRVTEHRGDVVTLELSTDGAQDAFVRITSADGEYGATLSVVDADGDETVSLRWNTYLAGRGGGFRAVGNDTVAVDAETSLDGRLSPGRYVVNASANGDRVDGAVVELVAPPTPSMRSLATVPTRNVSLRDAEDVRSALRADALRPSGRVMLREVLVLEVGAPGIAGALAAQPGGSWSTRLADLATSDGFHVSLREDLATVNLEQSPVRYRLEGPGVRLLPDARNDTYYLVLDVDTAPLETVSGDRRRQVDDGDWFDANLTVGPASGLVERRRTATVQDVAVVEPSVVLGDHTEPYVAARPNQRLSARTNLPTGVNVTVTVWTAASDYERRLTVPVTAGPWGNRVNATLNLTAVPRGATLVVRYALAGRPLYHEAQFAHVERGAVDVSIQSVERTRSSSGTLAVTANVTLPGHAFVVLHANGTRGRVLDASRLLGPGTHGGVTVRTSAIADVDRVVVVVHDAVGGGPRFEGDPAMVSNGTPVAAAVTVLPEPTATAGPAGSPTDPPGTPTTAPRRETTDGTGLRSPGASGTTAPGPGLSGGVLACVVAAAVLRRR